LLQNIFAPPAAIYIDVEAAQRQLAHPEFIEWRGPEVAWNGVVLPRERVALGFSSSCQQVQRTCASRRSASAMSGPRLEIANENSYTAKDGRSGIIA